MPNALKTGLAKSLNPLSRFDWNAVLAGTQSFLPQSLRRKDLNKVLQKLAGILKVNQREALYWVLCSYWMEPASVVVGGKEPLTALTDPSKWAQIKEFMLVMMYLDTLMYLPDDILVKVDRASMGVSLESRVPLPVSYTHLDVYKRQLWVRARRVIRSGVLMPGLTLHWRIPVSARSKQTSIFITTCLSISAIESRRPTTNRYAG